MTDQSADNTRFAALGDESFVLLTTFRKTGVPVSTPVWVARDGDALLVITPSESGKVKRLRNSGRVQLQACGRRGTAKAGAPVVDGVAEILPDSETARLRANFRGKYGFEFSIVNFVERLVARQQKPRLIVRITGGV
ncbi:PPOX class F420-dependent oxidoreductase [Subtercola sp. RTI3]|uniref:PPOX class F420-dependent oxidoreductase n=1 Tax=Subtercola sp. RTI3 TaxID=3048639 RepID=UPI002B22CFBA|nr:PPOX class F420-dependent oxidoreductase [Subtercola sp. RTI3]MEA9985089.1 PPOX class F420-dependent oxidoreductase [Subtercola sp. RTI3]